MAVITKVALADMANGQIAYPSSVSRWVDDLYTLQAGNINSANLATGTVGIDHLDYETKLFTEVFS